MKNLRTYLWIGLALILFVNYQTWKMEFGPRDAAAAQQKAEAEQAAQPLTANVPQVGDAPAAAAAAAATDGAVPTVQAPANPAAPAATAAANTPAAAPVLNVRTDVLDVDVSLRGGELVRADLLQYRIVKGGTEPVHLLRNLGAGNTYLLQTGLAGAGASAPEAYPTHLAMFTSDFTGFRLDDGLDEVRVPLKWTSPDGVMVTKTLIFRRGSYRIDIEYAVTNGSGAAWSVAPYAQIQHDMPPLERSFSNYFNFDSYSFTGPAYWNGRKYEKVKVDAGDVAEFNRDHAAGWTNGWIASLQHHFVTVIVPNDPAELHHYSLSTRGTQYSVVDVGPVQAVAPGASATLKQTLYAGPKLQHQMEKIHPQLDRAVDYGVFTLLARPLFWLLELVHRIFSNWGWAIVVVTFLLKLVLYPLSEISGRSAAKMKLLAPKMKALQEQYKDDRTKLGQATMELYRKEKINPATGCLPMLIQIPVFMAFYWVLVESVEMRQAPFMLWLQDLSSRDPFYILPVIMAGAMFLQYKLQPTTADPVQAKVMMIMPLVLSVTFAFLPSGLVLYYVVNTLLTILQQWNINRRIEAGNAARN